MQISNRVRKKQLQKQNYNTFITRRLKYECVFVYYTSIVANMLSGTNIRGTGNIYRVTCFSYIVSQ